MCDAIPLPVVPMDGGPDERDGQALLEARSGSPWDVPEGSEEENGRSPYRYRLG